MNIDIFQLTDILKRRWYYPVAGVFVCLLLAIGVILLATPLYIAKTTLIIDPAKLDVPVGTQAGGALALQTTTQLADSQLYLMGSREVLGQVVDDLGLQSDSFLAGKSAATPEERRNAAITGLSKNIAIAREDQSLVFSITVKHPASATSAEIANRIAETYLTRNNDNRSLTAERSASVLQAQAEELRKRLTSAQQAVEAYKAEHGLFSTGAKGLVQDQALETLNTQMATARNEVAAKQAAYEESRNLSVEDVEAGAITEAIQSTALTSLRTRYAQLLDTQAQLSANLGANHPQLKAAQSQAASMRRSIEGELSRIRESLKNEYLRAKSKLAALEREFSEATTATGKKANVKTRLAQLESDAKALDTLYQAALSNAESLSHQNTADPGSARVISRAVPPSRPNGLPKAIVLAAAVMFGFAAGCALAVLRAYFETIFKPVPARKPIRNAPARPVEQSAANNSIPVVARLVAEYAGDETGNNLVRFPLTRRIHAHPMNNRARDMGRMRLVHILETAADEARSPQGPYRVLFISSAGGVVPGFNLRGAAGMLANGSDVWVSDDYAAIAAKPTIVRSGSVKVSVQAMAKAETYEWQGTGLSFEHVAAEYPQWGSEKQGAFALLDACGTQAEAMLPVLMRSCDAVMVVSDPAGMSESVMGELTQFLQPWQEKVLGCIVVEPV